MGTQPLPQLQSSGSFTNATTAASWWCLGMLLAHPFQVTPSRMLVFRTRVVHARL